MLKFEEIWSQIYKRYPSYSYAQVRARLQRIRELFPELVEHKPGQPAFYSEEVLKLWDELAKLESEAPPEATLDSIFDELARRHKRERKEKLDGGKRPSESEVPEAIPRPDSRRAEAATATASATAMKEALVRVDALERALSLLEDEILFLRKLLEEERNAHQAELDALKAHYEDLLRKEHERWGQIWLQLTEQQKALPRPKRWWRRSQ